MKRLLLTSALLLPLSIQAQPLFHPTGANLTYGMNSLAPSVISATSNPAATASNLSKGRTSTAVGLISSVGTSIEFGPIDNFSEQIDSLITRLDEPVVTPEEGDAIKLEFDNFLQQAEKDGYVIANAAIHLPIMPLVFTSKSLGGALTFDINASIQAYSGLLYSELIYNPGIQEMETNSALYIKGAAVAEVSAGYSRQIWGNKHGGLYAGVTGKYYQVELTKNVISLNDTDDGLEDTLSEEFDQNQNSTTNFGIDLGLLWTANHYSLGVTLANANAPQFDYGSLGSNCDQLTGTAQSNCYTATSHSNKIDLTETYTMDPQVRLEATLHSANKHWLLSTSYDANSVRGPVGNEIQWMSMALGYAPDNWIPGVRFGYRENLAGSQLSMATFGLTLLKGVNLDVAYGLEEVEHEGDKYPRTIAVNLGVEMRF